MKAPGVNQWIPWPAGEAGDFLRDPLRFLQRSRERFGDVFRFRIGPLLVHFLYHPDQVQHVLIDHPKNYVRGWQYRLLRGLRMSGNVPMSLIRNDLRRTAKPIVLKGLTFPSWLARINASGRTLR